MKKKILEFLWLFIILLFIALQFYNYARENYFDIIASVLTVVILLTMIGVFILIKDKK